MSETQATINALKDCADKAVDTTPGNKNFNPAESGKYSGAAIDLKIRHDKLPLKASMLSFWGPEQNDLKTALTPSYYRYEREKNANSKDACENILASATALSNVSDKNLSNLVSQVPNKTAGISWYVSNPALSERMKKAWAN